MKNKFVKGLLVTMSTGLAFVVLMFGQRYALTTLSSLSIREKVSFISVDSYIPVYILGTILFSLTMGWLIYSRLSRKHTQNFFRIFGLRIKRNVLLLFSLGLLVIGSLNFYIFSERGIRSMMLFKGEFLHNTQYSNIGSVNVYPRFHLQSRSGKSFAPHYYCTLKMPVGITANGTSFETIIPITNMEDLADTIKSNNIPYNVQVINDCGDYPIPQEFNSRIKSAFEVETGL